MIRCFASADAWGDDTIVLDADEAAHLNNVLRCQVGDDVQALDGNGRRAACRIAEISKRQSKLAVVTVDSEQRPTPAIGLAQALVKNQHMDWLIQKAVELGIGFIVPIEASHCVVQIKAQEREKKRARWERIARGALKQSGGLWLPEIQAPTPLDAYLREMDTPVIHCSLNEGVAPLSTALESILEASPSRIDVAVGPEGDFSKEEYAALETAGASPANLGPVVLRAETAALYALSALRYEITKKG